MGEILALVMLYEIQTIGRFAKVGNFLSYARLVKATKESAGKRTGYGGSKIGNRYLKWAFSQAAVLMLRKQTHVKNYKQSLEFKHGNAKALSILAQRLGKTVYHMLKNNLAFDINMFLPLHT